MGAPSYDQPQLDPLIAQSQQDAQNQLITGLQTQTRSDSASLMAQYGALAMANGALARPSNVVQFRPARS